MDIYTLTDEETDMIIKLEDKPRVCNDPHHHPTSVNDLAPGTYMHICPRCGSYYQFWIPASLSVSRYSDCI